MGNLGGSTEIQESRNGAFIQNSVKRGRKFQHRDQSIKQGIYPCMHALTSHQTVPELRNNLPANSLQMSHRRGNRVAVQLK